MQIETLFGGFVATIASIPFLGLFLYFRNKQNYEYSFLELKKESKKEFGSVLMTTTRKNKYRNNVETSKCILAIENKRIVNVHDFDTGLQIDNHTVFWSQISNYIDPIFAQKENDHVYRFYTLIEHLYNAELNKEYFQGLVENYYDEIISQRETELNKKFEKLQEVKQKNEENKRLQVRIAAMDLTDNEALELTNQLEQEIISNKKNI